MHIQIFDDAGWENNEDFFVVLYDTATDTRLIGLDCATRITIIDDDDLDPQFIDYKRSLIHELMFA